MTIYRITSPGMEDFSSKIKALFRQHNECEVTSGDVRWSLQSSRSDRGYGSRLLPSWPWAHHFNTCSWNYLRFLYPETLLTTTTEWVWNTSELCLLCPSHLLCVFLFTRRDHTQYHSDSAQCIYFKNSSQIWSRIWRNVFLVHICSDLLLAVLFFINSSNPFKNILNKYNFSFVLKDRCVFEKV